VALLDLVRETAFYDGLWAGLLAGAVVAIIALVTRMRRPIPLAGVAGAIAALIALARSVDVPDQLVTGILALAVGGVAAQLLGSKVVLRAVVALPGAVLVAGAVDSDVSWIGPFVLVATTAGAALVADFDRTYAPTGLGPVLTLVTVLGIWASVPDTEEAIPVVGALLPIAFLGWPRVLASLGSSGAPAVVGVLAWTAAVGGRGRLGAVIGATACLGIMVLEPVLRRIWPARVGLLSNRSSSKHRLLVVCGAHLVLVAICSRVAGLERSPISAAIIVALAYVAVAVALSLVRHAGPRPSL
jgi:hypothetical protein